MAGKTEKFRNQWSMITSDRWILRTICGYQVELTDKHDQTFVPSPINFSKLEEKAINMDILDFTKKGIIEPVVQADPDEFISNILVRPRSDGGIRVILNLKPFNQQYVDKIHFKMESLKSAINAMTPNCFLASVDLKEAFYSIKIREMDRKYFRFYWSGQKYQFTSLIMELSSSPRCFTKILKPVYATLRRMGHISTAYIDDSCLQGRTKQQCAQNASDTVHLLDNLGFRVHDKKSVLIPTFVGFILNSADITVRLLLEKKESVLKLRFSINKRSHITIREFSRLIGKLEATEQGVEYAQLRYKPLETIKEKHLKLNYGNFDSAMIISRSCKSHIQWWIDNLEVSFKLISHGKPNREIYTDSSKTGWGRMTKLKTSVQGDNGPKQNRKTTLMF